ncbi:hypothetical protein H310_05988 [Aphanomyces invadans]|uniref:Secreted protein n=1 Tax=Aphanomyces invadans TaxID=157072 RepID=A0A024U9E0_9STRA|nr:hypothetical protein H310_05988 [Aphanomyces invadans]ETW02487.1 hypothetical protein H310_05988 [Aphanomyces invadans]|eukprot:XP_008869092.1 hypothetical protein H310_05988 [Aphanomyces invadans]
MLRLRSCVWAVVAAAAVDTDPHVPEHAQTLAPLEGVSNLKVVVLRWPALDDLDKAAAMKFNPMFDVTKYIENDAFGMLRARLIDHAVVYLQQLVHKVRNFNLDNVNASALLQKVKGRVNATYTLNKDRYAEMLQLSMMTFDQVRDYFNITDAPTAAPSAVPCPVPRLVYQFQGPPYLYATSSVARLYQPYAGYTMHYFGSTTTVPLIPAVGYPWPWNSSITAVNAVLEAQQTSTNSSVTVGVMQGIETIHREFHIPTGLPRFPSNEGEAPIPPYSVLSLPRSLPLHDALLQFYGYPKTSGFKAITALTWYRSTVTVFTPHLAGAVSTLATWPSDPALRTSNLKTLFDDAIDADIAGLIYGIESPSTTWLSALDRHSDEFADACLGQLLLASRTLPTAQAAFDMLTRRNEQKSLSASCLWDPLSAIFTAKMRSTRKPPPTLDAHNVAAQVALHVATRVFDLAPTKATMRKQRAATVENLLRNAVEMPVSAMGSNGVVHLGPHTEKPCVVLEEIKEPELVHVVQRVLIRLGESSLLAASEIDTLFACVCLRVLEIHRTTEVVECTVR